MARDDRPVNPPEPTPPHGPTAVLTAWRTSVGRGLWLGLTGPALFPAFLHLGWEDEPLYAAMGTVGLALVTYVLAEVNHGIVDFCHKERSLTIPAGWGGFALGILGCVVAFGLIWLLVLTAGNAVRGAAAIVLTFILIALCPAAMVVAVALIAKRFG